MPELVIILEKRSVAGDTTMQVSQNTRAPLSSMVATSWGCASAIFLAVQTHSSLHLPAFQQPGNLLQLLA